MYYEQKQRMDAQVEEQLTILTEGIKTLKEEVTTLSGSGETFMKIADLLVGMTSAVDALDTWAWSDYRERKKRE